MYMTHLYVSCGILCGHRYMSGQGYIKREIHSLGGNACTYLCVRENLDSAGAVAKTCARGEVLYITRTQICTLGNNFSDR